MKKVRVGVVVLLTLMMLGTFVVSAMADDPISIEINRFEPGATFLPFGDGTEPPPHIIVYNPDGTIHVHDPARTNP